MHNATISTFALLVAVTPTLAWAQQAPTAPQNLSSMQLLSRAFHPTDSHALANLTDAQRAALIGIARSPAEPMRARMRAMSLVAVHPDANALALWTDARSWAEKPLQIQAAWNQAATAEDRGRSQAFAEELLESPKTHIREIGIQVLFKVDTAPSRARAELQLELEQNAGLRTLIRRRQVEALLHRK